MIHVDVRTQRNCGDMIVEVSNDGAPWYRLMTLPPQTGEGTHSGPGRRRDIAETYARAFIDGARYAGAEARGTSHGYGL